ncbi:MAG: hypothetical protein KAQ83_02775 [Nanoarchaeota archaeon]|nr:hypothetical protein [Nanoarchaeota archaeon]
MTIISFNFNKISAEKKVAGKGHVKISNNISIKDVKSIDLKFGTKKDKALRFEFLFETRYEPKLGHISFAGNLIYMGAPESIKKIESGWKKNKTLPKDVTQQVMSHIVEKSNIEAIILSRTVALPSPVPLPKVKAK